MVGTWEALRNLTQAVAQKKLADQHTSGSPEEVLRKCRFKLPQPRGSVSRRFGLAPIRANGLALRVTGSR
jgi:hypothetical protein